MGVEINHFKSFPKDPKKRVLFVITQSEFGGAQRFLDTLIHHINRDKFELEVALGNIGTKDFLEERLAKTGIAIHRLSNLTRNPALLKDLGAIFELKKLYKKIKPDVIFLLSSKAGFVGSLAAKNCRVVYRIGGWTFNDPWPKWKKRIWVILEKVSARWKDVIIVNNEHDLQQAYELGISPRDKIVLIHNGLDIYKMGFLPKEEARLKLFEKISHRSGRIFQTEVIIGTIANLYPTKGLKYLIETAEHFKNKEEVIFLIIGDGPEKIELENSIKQKGLQKKVFVLGQMPDAHKLVSAFDIFVLPSVKEGFPWAVIEAMAAKLPVVATRVGALPEIIEDGKNGMLTEPAQPEQMVSKIQELLGNDNLKQKLGIQAHQTVLFKYPVENMIKGIEAELQLSPQTP